MMMEDENQLVFLSSGIIVNLVSNGVISFDLSGQVITSNYKIRQKIELFYYVKIWMNII